MCFLVRIFAQTQTEHKSCNLNLISLPSDTAACAAADRPRYLMYHIISTDYRLTPCFLVSPNLPAATKIQTTTTLVANEDKLVVVVPAVLLRIDSGLQILRDGPGRSGTAAPDASEPIVLQHIEGLLDEHVLQEEPSRVAIGSAMVGIAGLVQRITKHFPADRHPPVDQQSCDLPELDIRQAVATKLKTTSVADGDAAGFL